MIHIIRNVLRKQKFPFYFTDAKLPIVLHSHLPDTVILIVPESSASFCLLNPGGVNENIHRISENEQYGIH